VGVFFGMRGFPTLNSLMGGHVTLRISTRDAPERPDNSLRLYPFAKIVHE